MWHDNKCCDIVLKTCDMTTECCDIVLKTCDMTTNVVISF